jgi:hypothetical protein
MERGRWLLRRLESTIRPFLRWNQTLELESSSSPLLSNCHVVAVVLGEISVIPRSRPSEAVTGRTLMVTIVSNATLT